MVRTSSVSNAADHAAARGVTGLLTKPSFRFSKMFDPTELERTLVGSVDPRSALELALAHRLASLLWRLRRACAIETGLFEIQGELSTRGQVPSPGPSQPETLQTATGANGHSKAPGSNGRDDRPARDQEPLSMSMRPPLGPSHALAQCFLRLSNLDPPAEGPCTRIALCQPSRCACRR